MTHRERLREQLIRYTPSCEQEQRDKEIILRFLDEGEDVFSRSNRIAHFTASGWIVNPARDRVLMAYHNIYDSWTWTGGHADGCEDLLAVAVKEAREETGVQSIRPVSDDILSIEITTVDGHIKRGEYVSSHLHMNVTFMLEADESEQVSVKPDENSGVRWYDIADVTTVSSEPWMNKWIFDKIIKRMGLR